MDESEATHFGPETKRPVSEAWDAKSYLWPDPHEGPWALTLFFDEIDGRPECVGLSIRSDGDAVPLMGTNVRPQRLTTQVLRSIPFARAVRSARQALTWIWAERAAGNLGKDGQGIAQRVAPKWQKRGRRDYGDEHYRNVAEVYTAAWKAGDAPTRAVAEWGQVSRSAAANWVSRCRHMGLLGQTEKRKPGGIQTDGKGGERT